MRILLSTLSKEQCASIRSVLCPGCQFGLPDTRNCDRQIWTHHLIGTDYHMDCRANVFREAYVADCQAQKPPAQGEGIS